MSACRSQFRYTAIKISEDKAAVPGGTAAGQRWAPIKMNHRVYSKLLKRCMLALVGAGVLAVPLTPARADLEYHWKAEGVDVRGYEGINLFRMDLTGMAVEVLSNTYDGGDEAETKGVDEEALGDIANEFFTRFSDHLRGVLPLVQDKDVDQGRKVLITELALSGKFMEVERGLLMNLVLKNPGSRETVLNFKCAVKDSRTGQVLLELNDEKEFSYRAEGSPLMAEEDFSALSGLIGFWAKSFAAIVGEKNHP